MIYADTSFFVSVYVRDIHSARADQLLSAGARPFLTPLHIAEWAHAIAQQVFQQHMRPVEADQLHREFENDRAAKVWQILAVPDSSFEMCADLGRRYGPKFGARTLDTLHVACALALDAERFWTFDDRQLRLARTVGLAVRA
ncbi:MAG: type II toxin-antitoxin system VapC family toxin [Acidobacteria bacterium]|nr:type II toxin-antitoxin system VapC family toxin [Acidobacteriota bacterium]